MGRQQRKEQQHLDTLMNSAATVLAERLSGTPNASMTLFTWATGPALAVALGHDKLGLWRRSATQPPSLAAAVRVLAVAAMHTYAAAMANADISPAWVRKWIDVCGVGTVVGQAEEQMAALREDDFLAAGARLVGLIDQQFYAGSLGGDALALTMMLPMTLGFAVDLAVEMVTR